MNILHDLVLGRLAEIGNGLFRKGLSVNKSQRELSIFYSTHYLIVSNNESLKWEPFVNVTAPFYSSFIRILLPITWYVDKPSLSNISYIFSHYHTDKDHCDQL